MLQDAPANPNMANIGVVDGFDNASMADIDIFEGFGNAGMANIDIFDGFGNAGLTQPPLPPPLVDIGISSSISFPEPSTQYIPSSHHSTPFANGIPPWREQTNDRTLRKDEEASHDTSMSRSGPIGPDSANVLALRLIDPSFSLIESKTGHTQKIPATFQCTICPKRFTRAYNLRSHLRTHSDEQPFECTICGKRFARQHDRKRHEGLHLTTKKFTCRGDLKTGDYWGCGRRFARADALERHFRSELGQACIKPLLNEASALKIGVGPAETRERDGMQLPLEEEEFGNSREIAAPSDSGYQTRTGTDTASVCSFGSTGNSVGIPQDFLQDFTTFFGDLWIEKAGARAWAGRYLETHGPEEMEQTLDRVLRDYALKLGASQSANQLVVQAARLVRRYRPKISRYFRLSSLSAPSDEGSMTGRLGRLQKQLSLFERIDLLNKQQPNGGIPEEESWEDCESDTDEVGGDMRLVREFFNGASFGSLVTATRRALYFDDTSKMLEIRSHIESLMRPSGCHARFELEWKPLEFIRSQFGGQVPRLGSLVTLTGSALFAYCTTVEEYSRRTWPTTGILLLIALQCALDSHAAHLSSHGEFEEGLEPSHHEHGNSITFEILPSGELSADVRGPTTTFVANAAQQLSWLSAALSSSPFGDGQVAYCKTQLLHTAQGGTEITSPTAIDLSHFKIRRTFEPLLSTESPCWLPLFSDATISYGFPIPERLGEVGLEIPIDIMAALAGIRHAVEYDGGIVMKGFSFMFIPTKHDRGNDTIQWHLVSSPNPEVRLTYEDGVGHCPDRCLLKAVDLGSLRKARAIVGWHSAVEAVLGREEVNYENIDYSGAEEASRAVRIQGGSLGFQQFAMGQMDFTLGPKDGRCHFQRRGPYFRIVSSAEKTPVVLFDTGERRAWLVPASGVLLHAAQHRNWLDPYMAEGTKVRFKPGDSFKERLLLNGSTSLSDDEQYQFKDMITGIWSMLEYLLDQKVSMDKSSGTALKATLQDVLTGYEFKAVVEERSPLRLKQCAIKKTSGGWPLLARDIDALVLFANGFEDILRPTGDGLGLCRMWRTVPKGMDYLATTLQMIDDMYDAAGCRLSRQYLTASHLRWHQGDSILFDHCQNPATWRCRCNRLQQIMSGTAVGTITPPGNLQGKTGGVIFGESGTLLKHFRRQRAPEPVGLFSQPNVTLDNMEDTDDVGEEQATSSSSTTTQDSIDSSMTSLSCHERIVDGIKDLDLPPDKAFASRKRSHRLGFEHGEESDDSSRECEPLETKKRLRRVERTVWTAPRLSFD